MIRYIRVLGGALGGLIGLTLVAQSYPSFERIEFGGALIAAWVVAWVVVGFGILPYLTVIPAGRLIRGVQDLSTDEFWSKVQAYEKPSSSAFLVSSTTRLAGGFVWSVTPKSMLSS